MKVLIDSVIADAADTVGDLAMFEGKTIDLDQEPDVAAAARVIGGLCEDDDEIVVKLTKDLKAAVLTLSPHEVRFLVSRYYDMQENRIRASGQVRAMAKAGQKSDTHTVLSWLEEKSEQLEAQVKAALGAYSLSTDVGRWSRSVKGIGPVLAAGLMAHIDIEKAPTVGHIWSYAGLDPTKKWLPKTKRPWNAFLKTLCWKIGESFVKVSGIEDAFYGKIYGERKASEVAANDAGKNAAQAADGKEKVDKATDAWPWYAGCYAPGTMKSWLDLQDAKAREKFLEESRKEPGGFPGMLPPGHVHARAKRYAVKLFLAHWHEVAYKAHYKKDPPMPYPIAVLGHAHKIEPPKV